MEFVFISAFNNASQYSTHGFMWYQYFKNIKGFVFLFLLVLFFFAGSGLSTWQVTLVAVKLVRLV